MTSRSHCAFVALAMTVLLTACGSTSLAPAGQARDALPSATAALPAPSSPPLVVEPEPAVTTTPKAKPQPTRSPKAPTTERVRSDRPTAAPPTASANTRSPRAQPGTTGNPLANRPWGVYKGDAEMAWPPYTAATGEAKELLGRIALTPKAKWFGGWIPNSQIAPKVEDYIANSQAGDPNALVQMTFFRMVPWEHDACTRKPTSAEAASYREWIDLAAAAIGDTPTAVVLQPDGPFALCTPGGPKAKGSATRLVKYSAKVLSALPSTSVYIEIGASDWPHPAQGGVDAVLKFLIPSGVKHARGISLNGTHYASTEMEIRRAADVINALAARGIRGKKAVINTASNGHPWEFGTYRGPDIADNAPPCKSAAVPATETCTMLGIPPTADVASPAWGLPADTARLARQHVDGYIWFGRPWLYFQNQPFLTDRALLLAKTWPFATEAGF